jgi:hypothetical protein
LLTVVLSARVALACGAPFGAGVNVDPQQDIVVVHKNGVETYVFQPRFCGVATDFGLILPVPSQLTEAPSLAAHSAFVRVDAVSKPAIENRTQCYAKSSFDTGVGSTRADTGATVISSGKVGFLDWVQLKADSESAFTDWLAANGYPYDSQASATFTYYVQKGWYFLAFRISSGAVDGGAGTVCNVLGPIKVSFSSTSPVVPSRMASARPKDTSGSLSYASGFSWRIFGITVGDLQLGFTLGESTTRKLGYSGLLSGADETDLAGLGAAGDRLTRMTIFFPYGSTDGDVGLSLVAGKDFREVEYNTTYVSCNDAGVDAGVDAGFDSAVDGGVDAGVDSNVASVVDAGVDSQPTTVPTQNESPDAPTTNSGHQGGCNVFPNSLRPGLGVTMLVGWILVIACGRRRRFGRTPTR